MFSIGPTHHFVNDERVVYPSQDVMHNLSLLATFIEVARLRSFTRAGERLGLSQPGVSAHIRALERHLDCKLFHMRGRSLLLTSEGEALFGYAERCFNLLAEGERAVAAVRSLQGGILRLGASGTIGVYLLPPVLRRFAERYPAVQVSVAMGVSAAIVTRVLADEIAFGLIEAPAGDPRVQVTTFMEDEMALVVAPTHPWAAAGQVGLKALSATPLLRREAGSGTRVLVDAAMERVGVSPRVSMELGSVEALRGAVLEGLGPAWLPRVAVQRDLDDGRLAAVATPGLTIRRSFSLVARHDLPLPAAATAFLAVLREKVGGNEGGLSTL